VSNHLRPLRREGAEAQEGQRDSGGASSSSGGVRGAAAELESSSGGLRSGLRLGRQGDAQDDRGEGVAHEEAQAQEDHQARGVKDPGKPTREERAHHELLHVPFRPWCEDCVRGKAADDPHLRQDHGQEDEEMPKVSVDYGFISTEGDEELRVIFGVEGTTEPSDRG
jgi:hypothetical protein